MFTTNRRATVAVGASVALLILAGGTVLFMRPQESAISPSQTASTTPYVVPALSQAYTNATYRFSLMLPADFKVSDLGSAGSATAGVDTIVFQDARGNGIQVVISPFSDIHTLTQAMIEHDLPNMTVTDPQPVNVGSDYTGLAFESDNPAFNGASREVWFVFHGRLYQISTYERLDSLLKAVFGTWRFF